MMQGARPDEADGDKRRAGTPHGRGNREREEKRKTTTTPQHDSKDKDDQEREERGKQRRTQQNRERIASGPLRLLRTTQIAQEPLTLPTPIFPYPKNFSKLLPERIDFFLSSRQCGANPQGHQAPFLEGRRRSAEGIGGHGRSAGPPWRLARRAATTHISVRLRCDYSTWMVSPDVSP